MTTLQLHSPTATNPPNCPQLNPTTYVIAGTPNKNFCVPSLSQFVALTAGVAFLFASAVTNWTYATSRTSDPIQSLVWGSVAVAASAILALAPSAFIKSLQQRAFGAAVLAVVATILFGAYSVTAALGSATGNRVVASLNAGDVARVRADAEATIRSRSREIESLPPTRTHAELAPELDRLLGSRKDVGSCSGEYLNHPNARKLCDDVSTIRAEIGRADRRERADSDIRAARDIIAGQRSRDAVANTDADALVEFAGVVGVQVDPANMNRLLVILSVLVIELGAGLAFAVAGSLSTASVSTAPMKRVYTPTVKEGADVGPVFTLTEQPGRPVFIGNAEPTEHAERSVVDAECAAPRSRLLSTLLDGGGSLRTTQRALAIALGCSPARVSQLLSELRDEGKISMRSSATGTVISLT